MTNFTFTHRQLRVVFIALLCALFTLPLAAQNREAYVVQSYDKTRLIFFYDSLSFSRNGTIWTIERKDNSLPKWKYGSKIKKMVFDASFKDFLPTKIDWFNYQEELSSIEGLENLNTSAVTDMSGMFYGCNSLKELNLSSFNTSEVKDMSVMFSGCSGLKDLNLSSFNTSAVTKMEYMFKGCSGLTELNLSSFNTSAVTDMSSMFYNCSGLTDLNLSSFNTAAVTNMSSMFYGCNSLKELNLSSFNTSAVTSMGRMFEGCSGLKELNLSSFNTSEVTDMNRMFSSCSSLMDLNLSSFNTSKVRDMSFMFSGSGLKDLNLSSFNTYEVTNMDGMFSYCSGLKELNLSSSFNTSEVTNMDVMFFACHSLTTIYSAGTWDCEKSRDMFWGCTQLKGAVPFDRNMTDWRMANPRTGYFTQPKPTAIGRVGYNGNNATKVFTLQGKRVNGNNQHLPAGFYIVNGKKVYLGR